MQAVGAPVPAVNCPPELALPKAIDGEVPHELAVGAEDKSTRRPADSVVKVPVFAIIEPIGPGVVRAVLMSAATITRKKGAPDEPLGAARRTKYYVRR